MDYQVMDGGPADNTGRMNVEFTDADREKVRKVLMAALDEMSDSYSAASMYTPNAEIIKIALDIPDEELELL